MNEKEVHHIEAESFPTAIKEAEEWLASEVNEQKAPLIEEEELQTNAINVCEMGRLGMMSTQSNLLQRRGHNDAISISCNPRILTVERI